MKKRIFTFISLLVISTAHSQGCFFGETFGIANPMEIAKMQIAMEHADSLDTQIEAIVVTTCKKAGCWMEIQSSDGKNKMKVFMKDHAFGVPLSGCDGKKTVVNGRLFRYKLSVEYLRHLAEDAGKSKAEIEKITEPEEAIAIDAFGVWMNVPCEEKK
jgi:hypothetical protein